MSGLVRIIAHWAVTKYKCDENSLEHYHFIYEGDGKEVKGFYSPEANINVADDEYAQHTRGTNKGSIGVSCAAMYGATSIKKFGGYPIKQVQFEAMCKGIARLCAKYGIAVSAHTVLSHAEVQETLGIKQLGKWDISVLPFAKLEGATACGNYMRDRVSFHLKDMHK